MASCERVFQLRTVALALAMLAFAPGAFAISGREACNQDRMRLCKTLDRNTCDLSQYVDQLSPECKARQARLQKEEIEASGAAKDAAAKDASAKDSAANDPAAAEDAASKDANAQDADVSGREACESDRARICAGVEGCKLIDHMDDLSPKCRERLVKIHPSKGAKAEGAGSQDAD